MDALEEEKALTRQKVAQLPDQSNLANLAVSAYQTKKQAGEAESQRRAEEQARLKGVYVDRLLFTLRPQATTIFADHLGIAQNHPALLPLEWRLDPAVLHNATFTEDAAGTISMDGPGPDITLHTSVEGVPLEARVSYVGEKPFMILSAKVPTGSQGITSLEALGELIVQARTSRPNEN
jgi:hypothetical protein